MICPPDLRARHFMSLKAFHIVFIVCSVTLLLGLAGWAFGQYRDSGSADYLLGSVASAIAAVGLMVYGVYFLKKLKHVSYL